MRCDTWKLGSYYWIFYYFDVVILLVGVVVVFVFVGVVDGSGGVVTHSFSVSL